jgi:hypothetical protein
MECIYCGAELEWEDSYGNHEYICHGDISGKSGDIYRCPNHEGFETQEDAIEYALKGEIAYDDWKEITCDSSMHRVSGSFYTDRQENLHEGYPC